jgi:hypothetical protein
MEKLNKLKRMRKLIDEDEDFDGKIERGFV